jgi:hypothetical protein
LQYNKDTHHKIGIFDPQLLYFVFNRRSAFYKHNLISVLLSLLRRFLRNPSELKNIKNISLLRQQMSPSLNAVKVKPEPEPMDENMNEDVGPTDLSINQNSNNRLRSPSPRVKTELKTEDCFQYPQDLSISPVQLQLNMEAREAFSRHSSDSSSSSTTNSVPSQTQIKIEDTSYDTATV